MNAYEKRENEGRQQMYLVLHDIYKISFSKGPLDRVDFFLTAITNPRRTYVGDIKSYLDPQHPRDLFDYPDYMVDYDKLKEIKKLALNDDRIPVLICVFPSYLAIWNLDKISWECSGEWRFVNKSGVHYGEKEWELMAHLNTKDATIINYKASELKN